MSVSEIEHDWMQLTIAEALEGHPSIQAAPVLSSRSRRHHSAKITFTRRADRDIIGEIDLHLGYTDMGFDLDLERIHIEITRAVDYLAGINVRTDLARGYLAAAQA